MTIVEVNMSICTVSTVMFIYHGNLFSKLQEPKQPSYKNPLPPPPSHYSMYCKVPAQGKNYPYCTVVQVVRMLDVTVTLKQSTTVGCT